MSRKHAFPRQVMFDPNPSGEAADLPEWDPAPTVLLPAGSLSRFAEHPNTGLIWWPC